MSRGGIEQRLRHNGRQLSKLREDLRVTEEQMLPVDDEAENWRVRALVSETPLAERQYRRARRHAERLRRHRDDVVRRISRLESDQDGLLDKLSAF